MANKINYQVGFEVNQTGLKQLKTSLQQLQNMKFSDLMKINNSDISSAREALRGIQQDAEKVESALNKAFNAKLNSVNIQTFNQALDQSGLNIERVYESFSRAGATGEAAFRNLSTQLLSTNIQLREGHALLDKMAESLVKTAGWHVASSAVNGLTRAVEQAWGYVKSLDTSLNNIRIVTGKSADEMANFAVQANNAAKELGKTTTDYTNAALIYAQQGLNDQEIAERAAITLKTANVTGQSTDKVSEQLTAVWNGYKVTADEAELYVDRLAAVAATTASDLEELSTGMSKVASAAAAMGVGEDQLAAQLSTIISATKQAPESVGTALRTVYARISDIKAGIDEDGVTLGNYSGKMAELGVNVLDASGHLRDMGEVIEEIGGRWQDLTREQQISLTQTMAGQRQYNNLLALFDHFEQYNEALHTAQNAAGTLQEQQDIYMESTKAHLQVLKASIEDIYDSLIDANAKDGINGLIDGLSEAATFTANLVDGLGGGGAVLKALGSIGLTVFSNQIGAGLVTTINNLEQARLQAEYFRQAIAQAQKMQDQGLGDEYTRFLLGQQEQLLNLGGKLPVDEYNAMQEKLIQLSQNSGNIDIIEEKIELLGKAFNATGIDFEEFTAEWGTLDEALASADGVEIIKNALKGVEQSFDPVINKQKQAREAFKLMLQDIQKDSPNAAQSFENFKIKLQDLIKTLETATIKETGEALFNSLPENAKKAVEQASQELTKLDFSKIGNPQQASNQITQIFRTLNLTINSEIQKIQQLIESADKGQLEGLQKKLKALYDYQKQIEDEFDKLRDRANRTIKTQDLVSFAGGIAQLGSSIQQLQNLGSIWKNEDLSTGQKLLQIITNFAISVPMLTTGLTKAMTAMKLMEVTTYKNSAAAAAAITANAAHAVSLGAVGVAASKAGLQIQFFNTTLTMSPISLAAGAIALLIARFGAYVKGIDEAREATIEANKAEIDAINQKQATRQANEELWKSLDELDQKYKDGEISRTELKSSTQELISQYQLEEGQVKSLTASYDNLSSAIDNIREKDAEENLQSARREKRLAENNVVQTMRGTLPFYQRIGNNSQYRLSLDAGNSMTDESRTFQNALVNAGGKRGPQGQIAFDVEADAKSILELYDSISKAVEDSNQYMTSAQQQNSQYYQTAVKWLEAMRESAEAYKAALQEIEDYTVDFAAAISKSNGKINFDSIDNVDTYLAQREALAEAVQTQLQKEGIEKTEEELGSLVDSYLLANYSQIYNKYAEVGKLIQSIKKNAGDQIPEDIDDINKKISQLSQEQIDYIAKLAPNIKNWDDLRTILEAVSQMDFSNVEALSQGNSISDIYTNASDQYNKYQSLEEQVRGGKTISKKELDDLDPAVQGFFSRMANGTYKMTGDAQTFYNVVNNLKLDGFYNTITAINKELEKNQSLQDFKANNQNFNYDQLNKSSVSVNRTGPLSSQYIPEIDRNVVAPSQTQYQIDQDLVQKQLDYLAAVDSTDEVLQKQVSHWNDLLRTQGLGVEQAEQIYQAYKNAGDQTQYLAEKQQILLQDRKKVYQQNYDAMFPTDQDIDTEALQALSETISNIADQSEELADGLSKDTRAAQDVAESILRFDDAVTDVVDNYEDWMAVLNNGSISEQAQIMNDLRDAYADLLDLEGSSLSQDFLTNAENLELMKAAIDGDTEAYDQLLERAGQDIATQVHLDTTQFQAAFDQLMADYYQGQNLDDMQIGASLNNAQFLEGLSQMVTAAGMTAQQATDYLASMGVDAEVIETKTKGTETKQQTGWTSSLVPNEQQGEVPIVSVSGSGTEVSSLPITFRTYSSEYQPTTETVTDTKENSAFSLKVISAHKSSGGNFKFSQAPNGGGSKGQTRRNTPSKGGKGGGGGKKGGGSGKAAKPDTSQKDLKKALEDERDIYHDINIELQQINRNLDRAQKKQDRLYGKQLLDNLNEQSRILEQHKQTLKEKQKLQEEDLKQQRKTLKNLGVTFDKYGNISNYMSVMGKKQAEVNALIAEENRMIEAYNKQTNADVKKAIAEQIAEQQKKVKAAQDDYKNLQDKIKNYDEAMKGLQDTVDQVTEDAQKQVEINIQKFKMEVEIRLDMGQAERDWNKFRRQVLEHTDIIRDTDFHEIFGDATQNMRDLTSYFDVHGSIGSLQALTRQALATREQIEQINATGTSDIYGDNKAQAMEDLQGYLDELMDQMADVKKLIDDIDKAYLDTIDDIEKQFDKQIEDFEYIGELIEHDMDLLQLLYGDKNYDAMNNYYETLEQNNLKQLDALKQQRDFWKEQWDTARANGDTQAAKEFEERYREAIKNLNQLIEDSAKTIQQKYINAIDKIFDELDKKISNGKGTDYLNTEWDLMNKNADEYLDTINSAFAVQETQRKYRQALNDTKNIKNQQALKSLMDEQLGILKNKEKLTQYDVDRAEKLLQVEQARIALQDAQSAKTSMRLKRDSQGNYSYEYVADEGAIGEAEANLAAAQNDLYNFDLDRYKSNLNDALAAWRDFQQDYKDILTDTSLDEQQKLERLTLLREQYGEYINGKTEENLVIRNNLMDSAFQDIASIYATDVQNYKNMSNEEQNILMNDLVPAWGSGIQEMINKVAGEGGFIPTTEEAFNDVHEATKAYEEQLDQMAETAGIDLEMVRNGVDTLADTFDTLTQANDDLIDRMGAELNAIGALRTQAQGLVTDYGNVYTAAAQAVTELHNFVQAEQGAAAAYAQTATSYENMIHRIQRANADYVANPLGGSGYTPPSGGGSDNSGSGSGSGGSGSGGSGNSSRNGSGNKNTTPKDDVTGRIMGGEYYKKYYGYDTGGYTGNWSSTEGKLAILHQKQQVFNEDDTQKLLEATQILREITSNSDISLRAKMQSFSVKSITSSGNTNTEELQQNVSISASFPNVNSKREIEEAFNDLVNLAAQRAMRRR